MRKAISLVSFGVLCATLVLLMQYESPLLAEAVEDTPTFPLLLERGQNYSHTLVGSAEDNQMIINTTFGLPNYILNDVGVYVPYLLTDNATAYKIETNDGSLIFSKVGCNVMFYNPGKVNSTIDEALLSSESWIIHQRNLTDMSAWEYITDVNDEVCINTLYENSTDGSIILESNKTTTNIATFSTKYIKNEGIDWKVLTQVTNENPSWTNNSMGFIQTIHVPDTINLNGTDYYIPDNNGTFFDHNFFNDTTFAIMLGDTTQYLTDSGLLNLWGATLIDDNGVSKITFDYSFNDNATAIGETYEIDPTFSFTGSTFDAIVRTVNQVGVACPVALLAIQQGNPEVNKGGSDGAANCTRSMIEWDITAIPEAATITDVTIRYDTTLIASALTPVCDYNSMEGQPSTLALQAAWDDIGDGTTFVNANTDCANVNTLDQLLDLGASADADLQANLNVNWWGIGIKLDDEVRVPVNQMVAQFVEDSFELQVQYTTPTFIINIPTSFGATAVTGASGASAICNTPRGSITQPSVLQNLIQPSGTAGGNSCERPLYEFPTTALSNMTILDVDLEYRVITILTTRTCDFTGANTLQPSTSLPNATAATIIWDDISDGPIYVNTVTCQDTTPNPEVIDLGPLADADLQTVIDTSKGWFAIGEKFSSEARNVNTYLSRGEINTAVLVVEFSLGSPPPPDTTPPNKPLNVDATNNRDGKIRLTWDANNASSVTNYDIFNATDYTGPFTLLDTIGNLTTFAHTGLVDNFDQYYKISAWFNPNGTNSTIVFGTSGNPFVNDTDTTPLQNLWLGDTTGFETIRMKQSGTGAACPDPTSPTSVTSTGSNAIKLFDTADNGGCEFTIYTMDRSTTPQFLLPQFFEDYLTRVDYLLDIFSETQTSATWSCQYNSVSNAAFEGVDPRINLTRAYELVHDSALDREVADGYIRCAPNNQQFPEIRNGKGGNFGVTLYTNSMLLNSSFYSYSTYVNAEARPAPTFDTAANFDSLMKMKFKNPTFSKVWSIQEHPKFDDDSLDSANFEIKNGKFTMDTITDDTERGQVVLWKTFNKTQVGGGIDPNIRITGDMKAETSTSDLQLRFEIKDGAYSMGNDETSFPQNEFDSYNTGGSFGVVHKNPQSTSVESFDISMTPNWSNSTEDFFTIFIGIDDNSTSGSLAVNVTTVEIENLLKQDFEDLAYLNYYETSSSIDCTQGESNPFTNGGCLNARNFYNHGLVLAEQIANQTVNGVSLPTPPTPTFANVTGIDFTALTIEWNQSLLNTTDFQISRELGVGGGFVKLADTNNVTKIYEDSGLATATEYNYEICALNGEQIETTCITTSAFTLGLPFSAPQNLVATDNLLTQIDLTWDAENATGVTGYTIYNSSTGSIPFDILGDNSDNSTAFSDIGLPNNFDMFYKVSAFGTGNTNGTNSTVAMGSTIQPGQPVNIDNVNATAVLPFDVLLEWADSGVNITDYQIERNGTLIVPSLLGAVVQFLRDDFSTYPDNATADLTWTPTISGFDSSDDIVGVNTTSDRIEFKTNISSSSKIVFDLENLLGANLTDSSGVGDFNMTWTHRLEYIDSPPFNADTGEMKIILTDRDATPTGIQTGITVGFFQREPAATTSGAIRTAEDNNQFVTFEFIDNSCGLGSLTYQDTSPQDGVNDLDITVYSTLSKVGSFLEYKVGINPDYSGLGCVVSGTTTKTLDDIKLLKITRPATASLSIDHGWSFDDFAISTNGTLVKLYRDMDTSLGTNYLYDVSGINAPNGSMSIIGNPTTSNLVKTNDVPTQIQNVIADLANFFTLNQIELDWTQANNGSGSPLGEGVSLNETKIFSRNITDGGPFILTTTLFAASPPPTEYNDTNIIIPNDYSYMLSSCNVLGCGQNSTEIFADSIDFPNAIFDLLFYDLTFQSLILNWTQPFLGGGSLQDGYQLNFTTPFAEPLTIIISDTGSSFTEFTVSGLTELTNYTFRVSAINQAGLNATGLKLNVTTLDDFTEENFTVGFIGEFPDVAIDAPNIDIIPIRFERIDLNATTVMLNVTYANNIDLACSFDYKFAMTESFFDSPLDTVNIGGGDQETSFLFTDFDNEVIDVFCWNEVANQTATVSGSYILTQTNFPLLQQVEAFRDGDFGTEGMFGVLDMVTLMVIIISMIGFNRVNETVGAIFNIIFIGALSFFGIIELSTTIFAAIALVLMLVIISTRKV